MGWGWVLRILDESIRYGVKQAEDLIASDRPEAAVDFGVHSQLHYQTDASHEGGGITDVADRHAQPAVKDEGQTPAAVALRK